MVPARRSRAFACAVIAVLSLAAPASALADAEIRFVNASPGAGATDLVREGSTVADDIAFGEASDYAPVPDGNAALSVSPGDANSDQDLADGGRYTVIANGSDELTVIEDGSATGGAARARVVNAAPELGNVDVSADQEALASDLGVDEASEYVRIDPGTYDLEATKPGGGGSPLVESSGVPLTAGTSTTAVVAGSRGERLRFIVLSDSTAAPGGAPQTGLGGLAGDGAASWPVIAVSALAAGALGAFGWMLVGIRRRER